MLAPTGPAGRTKLPSKRPPSSVFALTGTSRAENAPGDVRFAHMRSLPNLQQDNFSGKNSVVGRPCYSLAVLRLQLAPAVPKLRITFESRLSRICRCSWSALSQACIWILFIDVPTCQEPSTSMLCRNHHRPLSCLLPPFMRSEECSILLAQVSAC